MKILSLLLSSALAQSPDLKPDSISRHKMTPEEALDFYTDMTQAEIDRLLSGAFDITQFNLAEDNLGFFRTMTGAEFMDIHFNYELFDEVEQSFSEELFKTEGPGALHKMGIIEYGGCGIDSNGEHFNITDGYVTSDGDWMFNKIYTGQGPGSWTHGWRYLGNIVGQVWNGGLQRLESLETSRFVTQAFFFPSNQPKATCSEPAKPTFIVPTVEVTSEQTSTTTTTQLAPQMTNNEEFVDKCGTRLRQLKGQYGMDTFDPRIQRQLHKRFSGLEKILTNAISSRPGRREIQMLSTDLLVSVIHHHQQWPSFASSVK